jgi:hypothetical protein
MAFARGEKKKPVPNSAVRQRSETSGGSEAQRLLGLQSSVGNAAVVQMLRQAGHPWAQGQHGSACGHQGHGSEVQRSAQNEAVQRSPQGGEHDEGHEALADSSPDGQKALLDAAMASPSRSLPGSLLAEAVPFFQNPGLSAAQLHDNPVAQRATAALGAEAMTVGTHIFAPPRVVADKTVMGHELSHVSENLKGTLGTGVRNAAGMTITDPGQGSERSAARDGASFGAGAATAPSLTAQRTPAPDAVSAASHGRVPMADGAVQRMESPPRGRRGAEDYEADASASDSSPERHEVRNRVARELEGLDDLLEQTDRLALNPPTFRRPGAGRPSNAAAYQTSESESELESPGTVAAGPAHGQLPELPEHQSLTELHDLLTQELSRGGLDKKLQVTFKVEEGSAELQQGGGHAWIEIKGTGGRSTSFGFYPKERDYRTYFGSVKGGVNCPDGYGRRSATRQEVKRVALKDIVSGYHLVHQRAEADYSFTLNNCSTFAGDVWKTMTGKAIPTEWFTMHGMISTVVANPYAYAQGLRNHQEARYERRLAQNRNLLQGRGNDAAPASGTSIGPGRLPGTGSALRAVVPGPGDAEEVADRLARRKYFQSDSSQSSDEVD